MALNHFLQIIAMKTTVEASYKKGMVIFMNKQHTYKTMNLHNRYLSVIALNLCKQLIIISGIFARLALINCIGSKDRAHMITILLFVAGSIFMENLLNLADDAQKLWITRKHSLKAREMVALKLAGLPLAKLEEHGIQEMPEKVEDYLKRSLDYSMAVSNFISFGVLAGTLLFLLKAVPFYVVLLLAAFMAAGFYFNVHTTKNLFGFWGRYMSTARRFNYFSDIQTRREYAFERRVYQSHSAMDARFVEEFEKAARINRKSGMAKFRGQAVIEAIVICVTVFTLFYFALPETIAGLTLGGYAAVTEVVSRLMSTMSSCVESVFAIKEFRGINKELFRFMEETEKRERLPLPVQEKAVRGEEVNGKEAEDGLLICRNVTFRYPGNDADTLTDFTFTFRRGAHYGLVGVNGAGKSTLSKLLLGLYEPIGGVIGHSGISSTALFQDFQIYPITVREYLMMGNHGPVPDSEILEILGGLGVTNLPDGLSTPLTLLTEEGTLLSKGQLQKLSIARAFLSDAEFIILDEPTASLDPISEKEIYEKCMEIFRGRTVLFITHRLGAVKNMDEILVLNGGKAVESGTHESLMERNGVYRDLYMTQRSLYIDEK